FRSSLPRLLHRRNTRYGWVASPYPTGTLTLQDAPSFSQRDNAQAQPTRFSAVGWNRLLGSWQWTISVEYPAYH
ncbi:MAG: hypothetical protein ACREYE_10815, partial [Gammaproteobacteria bacterium]